MAASRSISIRGRMRIAAASGAGRLLLRLLALTWRIRVENPEVVDDIRRRGKAFVLALWHGELLPITWVLRKSGMAVLISTHSDGEIIARIVLSLGYRPIRGSSSRGGLRALLGAISELESGRDVAFTTDGPRGPRRIAAPGAAAAALRAGVPIVAMGFTASSVWRLNSWDRFVIPKPFARISFTYAPPLNDPPADVAVEQLLTALQRAQTAVCAPDAEPA
ncbi:MAG: lysophospholipid acyltransferase family protein [Gemmatimonadota bacterium]